MAKRFEPKMVECVLSTDSFKIECSTKHEVVVKGQEPFKVAMIYRFTGKPLRHLIRYEEDYDELMANPNFRDYVEPSEKQVSEPSETPRAKKLREQKEAKDAAKVLKEAKPLKVVPASQTDGANSITQRPESD